MAGSRSGKDGLAAGALEWLPALWLYRRTPSALTRFWAPDEARKGPGVLLVPAAEQSWLGGSEGAGCVQLGAGLMH